MSNKMHDLMLYICQAYPYKKELSKARMTKLIYLSDWKMSQNNGQTITRINWIFNHHGPYVDDVVNTAVISQHLCVNRTTTVYGSLKEVIMLDEDNPYQPLLSKKEKAVIDDVIKETQDLYFADFIHHVYDTYPVRENARYSVIDLVMLAAAEKASLIQ